jgi:hypothetical protein
VHKADLARFMGKIQENPSTGCWEWKAYCGRSGYGRFALNGKMRNAHRVAFTHFVGDIVPGLVIDHLCRVRRCVNPEHLRAVTNRENTLAEGSEALVAIQAARTVCPRGHALIRPNLRARPSKRECLACNRAQGRLHTWRRNGNIGPEESMQHLSDRCYQRLQL